MTVLGTKSDPFQQSTCQQLPVAEGPAAGGEALKCAAAGLSPALIGVPDHFLRCTIVMPSLCQEKKKRSASLSYVFFYSESDLCPYSGALRGEVDPGRPYLLIISFP